MNRRGFALLLVLWVITALGVLAGVALASAWTGSWATRNRVLLTRAAWARNACEELLHARYAEDRLVRLVDTTDLGRGTWCRAVVENAGAKLDVNLASPEVLRAVIGNDTLADAVLERRETPLVAVAELRGLPGFDSARVARLAEVLTTRGAPQVDLNAAPGAVLRALPGMTEEAVDVILRRQRLGRRLQGSEEFLALLSPPARETILARYQDFSRETTYEPPRLAAFVEGGIRGSGLRCRAWVTVVPAGRRLAVVRREAE